MNIHEYQAKDILRQFGIPVPIGYPAFTEAEASEAIAKLQGRKAAVKAQIHAGGRGKAGGIRLAETAEEAQKHASALLGSRLVTKQTGPEGKTVRRLLIEQRYNIDREYYLAVTQDFKTAKTILIASKAGGMNIEETAEKHPEAIYKEEIDPLFGIQLFQARRIAYQLDLPKPVLSEAVKLIMNACRLFKQMDCTIVEINPLAVTEDQQLLALDAKIGFDDNALFRHPEIQVLKDEEEEDSKEKEAAAFDLNYIALKGNIGCMVNGAGLAMATMDLIKQYGGEPANFLDVGGDATADKVKEAFHIILSDPEVKGIFVNIFGGIMKCDVIAKGIVEAAETENIHIPLVVRLEGTNKERGREILDQSKLDIQTADSLDEGAKQIIALL